MRRHAHKPGRIAELIRAIGERLFREDDARAASCGWQAKVGHRGLSRTYRDPRFDSLMACPSCRGSGQHAFDQDCARCSGTGRIRLPQSPRPTEMTRGHPR